MTEHAASFRRGETATKMGFVSVALLGASKGLVGLTSGSISLLAQAVDSLKDLFALLAVFIGMRLSQRRPSERFPYGYYKTETFASLVVSILILLTGVEILRESAFRVFEPEPLSAPLNAVIVSASSIPIIYLLHRYVKRVGEEINSQSLLSQAADFRTDIYASSLVLVSVVSSQGGYPWVEGIAGVVISLLVLRMGAKLGWGSLLVLLDAVAKPEQMELARQLAEGVRGVRRAYNVRLRRSGPFCFGEITIGVDQRLPVEHAHRLSEDVERRVKEAIPAIESLVVHIEPRKETKLRLAMPILEDRGMNSPLTPHFGEAPYFLFIDVEENSVRRWMTRENPRLGLERKRGITVANLIIDEETTTLLTGQLGEGPFHTLRDSFVEIYKVPEKVTASEAVKAFLEGRLERIEEAKEDVDSHDAVNP